MSSVSTFGSKVKIERARKHLQELTTAIKEFFASNPFSVIYEDEAETGDRVYLIKINRQIPVEWGAIIGDIIHNARTALDLLAWQMVLANGGTPNKRTKFPISSNAQEFEKRDIKHLSSASDKAIQFIRDLKPYQGGNESLWKLHCLDITDKHRLILAVGAAFRHVEITTNVKVPWQGKPIEFPPIAIRPADRLFPLIDGAKVFRIEAQARTEGTSQDYFRFAFDIAFGDGEIVKGESVLPILQNLCNDVAQILDKVN
jgi:hypothetical protein